MKNILVWCTILMSVPVVAQTGDFDDPIQTDRPDQTETPALVPDGMFQIETGILYERSQRDTRMVHPTVLCKYGVNDHVELRLITEWTTGDADADASGINPVMLGMKLKLWDETGWVPTTSLIAHLTLPKVASPGLQATYYAPDFRFSMQHSLPDGFGIGYNVGSRWDGFTAEPIFLYTFSVSKGLSNRWGTFLEVFGFAPQQDTAWHMVDGGLTFLLTRDMMIDVSGGYGLTSDAPEFFTSVGFSFRI